MEGGGKMSAHWEYLISLYHCGVRGIAPPEPPEGLDWEALAALADRQAVTPVIFSALRKADFVPAQLWQKMRLETLELSLQNRRRQEAALDILEQLRDAGLTAAVLKGMSVARYFAAPETRICADTDILISPDKEQEAIELFGRLGFTVTPRAEEEMHHFTAEHPAAGLFEVHVRLWDGESALAFGSGEYSLDPAALPKASLFGRSFFVLPQTDELQYLCLHRIRHFVRREEGLRTAYDTALFFAENRNDIRCDAFWKSLRRWNADIYFNTLLSVFVRAGCFREEDFPGMTLQDEGKCALFSADMEQYSSNTLTCSYLKIDSWMSYTRAQAKSLGGNVKRSYNKRRRALRRIFLFPPAQDMAERYPTLKRHPRLYPFYWIHRCVTGVLSKQRRKALRRLRTGQKKLASVRAEAGSRTALMQDLGFFRK